MNRLEELLQKAKQGERIIISTQFQCDLKKRILSSTSSSTTSKHPTSFFGKRMMISLLPMAVAIVVFVFYYTPLNHPITQTPPTIQREDISPPEARLFSNQSAGDSTVTPQLSTPSGVTTPKDDNQEFRYDKETQGTPLEEKSLDKLSTGKPPTSFFSLLSIVYTLIGIISLSAIFIFLHKKNKK